MQNPKHNPKKNSQKNPKNKKIKKAAKPLPKTKSVKSPSSKEYRKSPKGKTLYVGNLRYDKDEQGVKHLFSHYGRVKWAKVIIDPETGRSKGIAFVEMPNEEEAMQAIKNLNGKVVENRTLKVSEAIPLKRATKKSRENLALDERPLVSDEKVPALTARKKKLPLTSQKSTGKTKEKDPAEPAKSRPKKKKKTGLAALLNYLKK